MGFVRYAIQLLRLAVSKSLDLSQTVLFLLFVSAGIVASAMPGLLPNLTTWKTAAWVVSAIVALRLVLAPYWMHEETIKRATDALTKLEYISLERALGFADPDFDFRQRTSSSTVEITKLGIHLENLGEQMLKYEIKDIYLERSSGVRAHIAIATGRTSFALAKSQTSRRYDVEWDVGPLPASLIIGISVSYDNVPPVRNRITGRRIKIVLRSIRPVNYDLETVDEIEE
jgi:hypothetical protein